MAEPRPATGRDDRGDVHAGGPGADALRVGGLTALSATDYPGELAAVVFCQGCPWRCGYCHNPHLVERRARAPLAWDDVMAFLRRRQGLLDAVVFSGGEPLVQRALPHAMRAVRALGFRVGLHTGGASPAALAAILPLVDWIGFDVKAGFDDYPAVTGVRRSGERARESLGLVLASGVAYELRTTVHPGRHTPHAVEALAQRLAAVGARRYVLQEFRPGECLDPEWTRAAGASFLTPEFCARVGAGFDAFEVRRA